jgi:L-rhamnose mutarotase
LQETKNYGAADIDWNNDFSFEFANAQRLDWDGVPNRKYREYKKIATEFKRIEKYFPYQLKAEYEYWHRAENGWPEIKKSIGEAGITSMEIYRTGNRLFMIMETEDHFTFDQKSKMDAFNNKVQEWEQLMWKFQQPLPWAKAEEKWIIMNKIFELHP